MNPKNAKYAMMHVRGCGKAAYLMDHAPASDDPVLADGCYFLDGRPKNPCDPVICESCGVHLGGLDIFHEFVKPNPLKNTVMAEARE